MKETTNRLIAYTIILAGLSLFLGGSALINSYIRKNDIATLCTPKYWCDDWWHCECKEGKTRVKFH